MLKNYFIAAIRAIRRSPWEAMLKIFAIAAGVCASVIHLAFFSSGDFSDFHELWPSLVLIFLGAALLEQFYGQPQNTGEYKVRIILGDEDLLMRGRKITEAALVIFAGVILGLVISDSYFTYFHKTNLLIPEGQYMPGILILGFFHFTFFLFTVWFGSAIGVKSDSIRFSTFSKTLAGGLIFVTSLFAIFWSVTSQETSIGFRIYLFDIVALSCFSYASWNKLAQYTLESKVRQFSTMKLQGASTLRMLFYWIQQLGPSALISVGLSILIGNLYLILEMPFKNSALSALITFSWTAFITVIIILGLSQAIARGFKQETNGFINHE
ncbi:MAG TPA: hypothetical protein VGA21_11315 [Cyclobacteriaceae bacterium]